MNTKIFPKEEEEEEDNQMSYFVYDNKEEYLNKRNKMFNEIKERLVISDEILNLVCYSGIYEYYKITKINEVLKKHLTNLTNGEQEEWVNLMCWNVIKTLECSFESLPFNIIKSFKKYEFEKYLYDVIYYSLMGINMEGFLQFIEEKNIYINQLNEVELLPNNMELDDNL
tara:strand:+ start:9 stop:518 length:510 start_codon:yes stop_codon:yes gene_type:complete